MPGGLSLDGRFPTGFHGGRAVFHLGVQKTGDGILVVRIHQIPNLMMGPCSPAPFQGDTSRHTVMLALSLLSTWLIRSRYAWVASTGETCLSRIRLDRSVAERKGGFVFCMNVPLALDTGESLESVQEMSPIIQLYAL